jgi:GTPase Era involved in 16S rRNA processing
MVGQESDEKTIVSDKPFTTSVAEILREKAFSGLPVRELPDTLIDF